MEEILLLPAIKSIAQKILDMLIYLGNQKVGDLPIKLLFYKHLISHKLRKGIQTL